MKVSHKKTSETHVDVEVTLEAAELTAAQEQAVKRLARDVKVSGFRKGKAPADLAAAQIPAEKLAETALDIAVRSSVPAVFEEIKLEPVEHPHLEITKYVPGEMIEYKTSVDVLPEIKLADYRKLKVKKPEVKVGKKEVDEVLAQIADAYAERKVAKKPAALGDEVTIDFTGTKDGKEFEGGKAKDYKLALGSGQFIPGFEEGLVGMKVGETKELNLKFPSEYTKELANKDVKFKVTVREIKERVLPELNKDFYADLGYEDIETEEDFRKEVKKVIEERKKEEVKNKYLDDVLEAASKNMEVSINPEIIDDEIHRMINQFGDQLRMQGLSVDQYLQFTGLSHEDLHKQMEPEATKRVRYRYLIEEVANAEKIEISDEDANSEASDMAANYDVSKEEFLTHFGGLEVVKYDMRMRKALEILGGEEIK